MKEQIYTIPVNEVYDTDCACPLCELEKRIETESVEYSLGAAMMEPDYRVESNERGYCNKHYGMMFARPNKLSLALVLDTHMIEVRKKFDELKKSAAALKGAKTGFFKKSNASDVAEKLYNFGKNVTEDCMVCKKVSFTMERYIDVILYMWATRDEFKEKFSRSKGFCLKHFYEVCKMIPKSLSDADAAKFIPELAEKEGALLDALQEDIHKFTLKFDYRNKDMPWGTAEDAPIRTIEVLAGSINENES